MNNVNENMSFQGVLGAEPLIVLSSISFDKEMEPSETKRTRLRVDSQCLCRKAHGTRVRFFTQGSHSEPLVSNDALWAWTGSDHPSGSPQARHFTHSEGGEFTGGRKLHENEGKILRASPQNDALWAWTRETAGDS